VDFPVSFRSSSGTSLFAIFFFMGSYDGDLAWMCPFIKPFPVSFVPF